MWIAFVIVGALVGVALIWWSVALGLSFLVLPIVVCELVLFGAVYLMRQTLAAEADSRERSREWHMERTAQRVGRPAGSRPRGWEPHAT